MGVCASTTARRLATPTPNPSPQGGGDIRYSPRPHQHRQDRCRRTVLRAARAADQTLLVAIALHRLEILAVGVGETIGPRIVAQNLLLLLPGGPDPGQRHDARIGDTAIGQRLGLVERLDQIGRDPRIFVDDLLTHDSNVHDRKDAGLAKVRDLHVLVVREQAHDALVAFEKQPGNIGRKHRRDFAFGQHDVEPLAGRRHLDAQVLGGRELDVLLALDHPGALAMRYAVMLFKDAAHPDVRGRLEIGAADPFADQVFRRADAGIDVDERKAVAEAPVQKHRNGGERFAAIAAHQKAADIDFADIEFGLARHAPMALARAHAGQHDKLDAVALDRTVGQRPHDLVIAAGDGQFQLRHLGLPHIARHSGASRSEEPGIHNHRACRILARVSTLAIVDMDSGLATSWRPGMTGKLHLIASG